MFVGSDAPLIVSEFSKVGESWKDWRQYALDPRYQVQSQQIQRALPFEHEKTSPLNVKTIAVDWDSPIGSRKLFEEEFGAKTEPVCHDWWDEREKAHDGSSPTSIFLHDKSCEHMQDLMMAEHRVQARAEFEQLSSNLLSSLEREADLKASLDICSQVGWHWIPRHTGLSCLRHSSNIAASDRAIPEPALILPLPPPP